MSAKLSQFFKLEERKSTFNTEILAGLTTFMTMSYIIFVQPDVLSKAGMDMNALIVATCITAAFGSILMGILANYPIALAPGMGENFFFAFVVAPACATILGIEKGSAEAWQLALAVVFVSGLIFAVLSLFNIRETLMNAISPSLKHSIAGGIGLFIAFIGLEKGGLISLTSGHFMLSNSIRNPGTGIFLSTLIITASLKVLKVKGAILWGILAGTVIALLSGEAKMVFPFSTPPSPLPVMGKIDISGLFKHLIKLVPFILIFTIMDVFDTMGTLIGVSSQAGLLKDNKLPNAKKAFAADACGTVFGTFFGQSTVTAYIESAAGVENGGRTGIAAIMTGICFLLAIFCSPFILMVAHCQTTTAPALVLVGAMMAGSIRKIDWDDYSEAIPSFLILIGIPFTYSISDGLALGFIAYPIIKLCSGKAKEIGWLTYLLGGVLLCYILFLKSG